MAHLFNLSEANSIANKFIAELRDESIQKDAMRFRNNLRQIAQILGYELSKTLDFVKKKVPTCLGVSEMNLPNEDVVLATILRAGLPMHEGLLDYFNDAGSAFISAYRMHHKDGTFEIKVEYISCPNLDGKVLIVSDSMLATGASLEIGVKALLEYGTPKKIHIISTIASKEGVDFIQRMFPDIDLWIGAIDEELTAKSYIVPGLGDAGDLAYGEKLQG